MKVVAYLAAVGAAPRRELLAQFPEARAIHATVGGLVVLSFAMSTAAAALAAQLVFHNRPIAVCCGATLGVLALLLNRLLLAPHRKAPVLLGLRVLLAGLLTTLVAEPALLMILRDPINEELRRRHDLALSELRAELQKVDGESSRLRAEFFGDPPWPAFRATQRALAAAEQRRRHIEARLSAVEGDPALARRLEADLEIVNREISRLGGEIARMRTAHREDVERRLMAAQQQRDHLEARLRARQHLQSGLATQWLTLADLEAQDTSVRILAWAVRIVFFLLELLPILVKALLGPTVAELAAESLANALGQAMSQRAVGLLALAQLVDDALAEYVAELQRRLCAQPLTTDELREFLQEVTILQQNLALNLGE